MGNRWISGPGPRFPHTDRILYIEGKWGLSLIFLGPALENYPRVLSITCYGLLLVHNDIASNCGPATLTHAFAGTWVLTIAYIDSEKLQCSFMSLFEAVIVYFPT